MARVTAMNLPLAMRTDNVHARMLSSQPLHCFCLDGRDPYVIVQVSEMCLKLCQL
jgi:hypothetical protein